MSLRRRVLVIDQDAAFRRYAAHVLGAMNYHVAEATSGRAGLNELSQWTPDCVIVDLDLTDIPGIDVLRAITAEVAPRPPAVVVSANLTVDRAVESMKSGARDAVEKPLDADRLRRMILKAVEHSDLARDTAAVSPAVDDAVGVAILESEHVPMQAVVERVERLAAVEMPVLFVGERGTGKAQLARRLHASGTRRDRPFVEVPGGESPEAVEAALFGSHGRESAFAQAQDGTVFVRSLVSLGMSGQQRLARVLTEVRDARASGQPIACPRIIVGCDEELSKAVALGRVREDVAHRLSPLTVTVPPLRERRKDVPRLVRRIVEQVSASIGRGAVEVSDELMQHLSERDWPGNVDELQATVVRGVVLARDGRIRLEDVLGPSEGHGHGRPMAALAVEGWHPTVDEQGHVRRFDEYEAEIFRFALDQVGGCVSRAAEKLGVGRATMYRKMRSYDIDAPPVAERAIIRTGRRSKRGERAA